MARPDLYAYRVAYDLLFRLAREFVDVGVSTILDMTMGWEFQWRALDEISARKPPTVLTPILLRCDYQTCIDRIARRHAENPDHYDPPEVYRTTPKIIRVWDFLASLERPDARFIDANGNPDLVFRDVVRVLNCA